MLRDGLENPAVHLARRDPLVALLQPDGDRDRFVQADGAVCGRSYPSLLPLMSYLKWIPASSVPSDFCGLYSRSTFANCSPTFSANVLASSLPPGCTPVTVMSLILMMRNSCWPLPALRTVIVASLMCSPVAHAFSRLGDALST